MNQKWKKTAEIWGPTSSDLDGFRRENYIKESLKIDHHILTDTQNKEGRRRSDLVAHLSREQSPEKERKSDWDR
jgi:hypothetical protein